MLELQLLDPIKKLSGKFISKIINKMLSSGGWIATPPAQDGWSLVTAT